MPVVEFRGAEEWVPAFAGTTVKSIVHLFRLGLLALFLFAAPLSAWADGLTEAIAGLGGDSFAAKEKAVIALAKSGEPRAALILQALAGDRLRKAPDGRVVIIDTGRGSAKLTDAATGQPVADLAPEGLDRIIVNNRLRGAIEAALGTLTLFSPDREARLGAAQDALRHHSADTVAVLEKSLAAEQDSEIRAAMQRSLAASQLFAGSKEERLAAIRTLGSATDPQVKNLLDEFRYTANIDPDLYKAAGDALAAIDSPLRWLGLGANLFQGISLGSVLLLAAIGLAITFGVMGVINMAHGEMIMTGAYVAFVVQQLFRAFLPPDLLDAYLLVAVPVAFLFAGLLGVLLERCLIRFLYGRPLETLLATWGLSLILQQAVRTMFGSTNREVGAPSWMSGTFSVGQLNITYGRLWIIVFTLMVFVGLLGLLRFTRMGLEMRAVPQTRAMAASMGIRTARVDALTFGLGSGIAGIAGVALSQIDNVRPPLGQRQLLHSLLGVVCRGLRSLWPAFVGAFAVAIASKFLAPFRRAARC